MKLSRICKIFALCLCAGACFSHQPVQADIPEIPSVTINIQYNRDFNYAGALEKEGYKAGFAYNLNSLLQQNPELPAGISVAKANSTVKKESSEDKKFAETWLRRVTTARSVMFAPGTKTRILKQHYVAGNVSKHEDLKLNEDFLTPYRNGKANLDKRCQAIVITNPKRKEIVFDKEKMAISDLKVLTALTPVALIQKDKTVYVAFLDYKMLPIDIDEDEHTGRFDPPAKNFACSWEALYLFPLNEIITPAPKGSQVAPQVTQPAATAAKPASKPASKTATKQTK